MGHEDRVLDNAFVRVARLAHRQRVAADLFLELLARPAEVDRVQQSIRYLRSARRVVLHVVEHVERRLELLFLLLDALAVDE